MPDLPPAADERDEPRLCQACHEALAVVRVFWSKDGEDLEADLCAECARKLPA